MRVTQRKRLMASLKETPDGRSLQPVSMSGTRKKEELFAAIGRAWSFAHGSGSAEDFLSRMRQRYPAPQYLLEVGVRSLEHAGVTRQDAFYFSLIPALTRTGLSQQWGPNPRLERLESIREYVKTLFLGIHVERCYLVMLDRQGQLIRTALLQRGAVDNAPFYLGQVLTVALQEEARFLVLAHNHPGGTKRPSREDILCTLRTLNAFMPLQIALLDHLIVAGDEAVSVRRSGLIPAMLWRAALPGDRIVEGWLSENLNNS